MSRIFVLKRFELIFVSLSLIVLSCDPQSIQPGDVSLKSSGIENIKVMNGELHFSNPELF